MIQNGLVTFAIAGPENKKIVKINEIFQWVFAQYQNFVHVVVECPLICTAICTAIFTWKRGVGVEFLANSAIN